MTTLAETELLRSRWRRALKHLAVDTVDRDDFALGSLARRLRLTTAQLLVLPPDPEAGSLQFHQSFWAWIEANQSVDIGGHGVQLGNRKCPTAHAAALVRGYGESEPWTRYVAVHRSGIVELGLGDQGGWERVARDGEQIRVFNLISIVGYTWALLRFVTQFNERFSLTGPWQVTVALRGTEGAWLGNVGQGWAEPGSFENDVGGCPDSHLLWHTELRDWPDDEGQQRFAFGVGDWIEDAWGVMLRRYLARIGERAGHFDLRQLRG